MMTEDDLHNRLHQEAASVRPPGDLMETLAGGHARRHRRAARLKMGGAAVAIVAVAGTLTAVLAPSGPSTVQSATGQTSAEIIQRAKEADVAAQAMILHATTTISTPGGTNGTQVHEGWVLRSPKLARVVMPDMSDLVVKGDGTAEEIDYPIRTVWTAKNQPVDGMTSYVTGSGLPDFTQFLADDTLKVDRPANGLIRLTATKYGMKFSLWLDERTYRPVRSEGGNYRSEFTWLQPTAENMKSFDHTVPADFTRKER